MQFTHTFKNKSVLITGHTGFKGSWLALWLRHLGAQLHGVALDPPTTPVLFDFIRASKDFVTDTRADIRDLASLEKALTTSQPEVVFHLAAQPLVRESYRTPIETFQTNIIGSANLMETIRKQPSVKAVVIVTTDKVYKNREWPHPYRELDELGGHDPYSASKAACEILISSMRSSFFENGPYIATARAGNVIGGGDFSVDRLIPDCLRAFGKNETAYIRSPNSVRPWQHVLDSLSGYLLLAEKLLSDKGAGFASAWNFGPDSCEEATVGDIASRLAQIWGGHARIGISTKGSQLHEAGQLRLDNSLARKRLQWKPSLDTETALNWTVEWEMARLRKDDMRKTTYSQIEAFQRRLLT